MGDAGKVQFRSDGDSLTLVNVQTNDGWSRQKTDTNTEDIEIDFRKDNAKAEFEAELDHDEVDLEIDQKIFGSQPN